MSFVHVEHSPAGFASDLLRWSKSYMPRLDTISIARLLPQAGRGQPATQPGGVWVKSVVTAVREELPPMLPCLDASAEV
jgi:hypothetical protein